MNMHKRRKDTDMAKERKKLWLLGLLAAAMVCIASCGTAGNDSPGDKDSDSLEVFNPTEVDSNGDIEDGAEENALGQKEEAEEVKEIEKTEEMEGIEEVEEMEEMEETAEEPPVQKIDYEAEIRKHYVAKKEYEELIRAMLLGNLEAAKYIELPEDEENINYRKMITDAIVEDSIEGDVLSEGVKSVIDGVCEQKSIDEIMQETANGLMEGVQNEVKSTIQGTLDGGLSGIKELKLFEAVAWIDEFFNVNDIPVGLLNGMVELQRADVEIATALLMQGDFYNGDLPYLSAIYKRLCSRQNEIILAGGNAQKLEQEITLDELIGKWNHENSMILALDAMQEESGYEISSECKENVSHFRDFSVQGLQACYDVAGYKAEQKNAEQAGLITEKIMGGMLGAMVDKSQEVSQETIQQEKIKFYGLLENSMADSYLEVCRAKNNFDILYGAEFKEIVETQDNMLAVDEEQIYGAVVVLLDAVSRYSFDLKTAILFWENTLSDNETNYLGTLKYQLDQCYALLNEGMEIGIWTGGYSVEEQNARYVSLMDAYMDYLYWSIIYIHHEPVYSGSSNVTAYGVGNFNVYYRGLDSNPFIFAEQRLKSNYQGERYLWIYNKEGDPIYIRDGHATVYVMDNVVIEAHSPSGEDMTTDNVALQLYNNAVRIRSDFLSGNLAHGYENYVF